MVERASPIHRVLGRLIYLQSLRLALSTTPSAGRGPPLPLRGKGKSEGDIPSVRRQPIPHAAHGLQVPRRLGVVLDLAAQAGDLDVDGAAGGVDGAPRQLQAVDRLELARDTVDATGRAVDVQVTRLRRKIEPDPKNPRYLQTVRGIGYRLAPD